MTKRKQAPRHVTKQQLWDQLQDIKTADPLTVFSTRITTETKDRIRAARFTTGKSVQELTEAAFTTYLDALDAQ